VNVNNLRAIKSTILGVALIVIPIITWMNGIAPFELWSVVVISIGIALLFSPDTVFASIDKASERFLGEKKSNDECQKFDRNKRR
jgi:uncharacterized membrane protein